MCTLKSLIDHNFRIKLRFDDIHQQLRSLLLKSKILPKNNKITMFKCHKTCVQHVWIIMVTWDVEQDDSSRQ